MNWLETLFSRIGDAFRLWVVVMPWQGSLRVRCGKHVEERGAGMHLRLPIIDRFYVQSLRLRTVDVPLQTVTTSDAHALTVSGVIQYKIGNLRKLYDTLHQPDDTVIDLASVAVAEYVSTRTKEEVSVPGLQDFVNARLDLAKYGLHRGDYRVSDFAFVKTYRHLMAHRYKIMPDPVSTDLHEA